MSSMSCWTSSSCSCSFLCFVGLRPGLRPLYRVGGESGSGEDGAGRFDGVAVDRCGADGVDEHELDDDEELGTILVKTRKHGKTQCIC